MNTADIKQFEQQMQEMLLRYAIAELAWGIIGAVIFFLALYLTLRYAIRDGLRDARFTERPHTITRERDRIEGPELRTD